MESIRRFTIEYGFHLAEEMNDNGSISRECLFNFADGSLHDYRYEYGPDGVKTGDVVSIVSKENRYFSTTRFGEEYDYLLEGHFSAVDPDDKKRCN